MPKIRGIRLEGCLPDWVSAKDAILELLRRHGVSGCKDTIIEYYGPGLATLSVMDRHVLANLGTEMGATATVFPSDDETRRFLAARGREMDWTPLAAEPDCCYDFEETLDLSNLEPLIALPSSPDKVVTVREIAGEPLHQAYIGSSGNPGYRDFAVVAEMVRGRTIAAGVSLDINPSSRQVLASLIREGHLEHLVSSGARLHQAGCNGCIGMGQAPAVGRNSLRTVPRNFPGRSGTREDRVFLCSPETAAASALKGVITDPRTLDMPYPRLKEPDQLVVNKDLFISPLPIAEARLKPLQKTDNTPALPRLHPLSTHLDVPVLLVTGDNISTDDIMPAGQRVMPYWSSIYASAPFTFEAIDPGYINRAEQSRSLGGHAIVGGHNYGQGSSRENAALVPRYLGLQVIVAKSFARIHWQNLVCFGALPLTFVNEEESNLIVRGDRLVIRDVHLQLSNGPELIADVIGKCKLRLHHGLSERQRELLLKGGVINEIRSRATLEKI